MGTEQKGRLVTVALSEGAWQNLHRRAERDGETDEAVLLKIAERELAGGPVEELVDTDVKKRLMAFDAHMAEVAKRAGTQPPGLVVEVIHSSLDGDET